MNIHIMKSKIHRAVVTEANLNYVGSITIDENLMESADLVENEKVQVVNINNGERFETYVIKGKRDSGTICLNGAAARCAVVGDIIIIISYGTIDYHEACNFHPTIIHVDGKNCMIKATGYEVNESDN